MKTVVSKTGIEVLYPCTVHLLRNGEILECEYKSDHTGQDLLDYICQYQNLSEKEYWGLRFVDIFDHKHWLELDHLIRPQVKNVCPIHFHFRVKVYPAEPHKIKDIETRRQFFMQLRYDLITGRLCSEPNDSALILALILQYTNGDFNPEIHFGNYIKSKIMLNQTFTVETKAIDIHKQHLNGLTKAQVEDLFLRMACQLETYGVDPHLVEGTDKRKLNLWINYKGLVSYFENKVEDRIKWMDVNKITQDNKKLIISVINNKQVVFVCLDEAECKYIYRSVLDHLTFFTSSGRKSTITLIGSEPEEEFEHGTQVSNRRTNEDSDERGFNTQDDDDDNKSEQQSDDLTLVDYASIDKNPVKPEDFFRWLSSTEYILHVAVLILGIGVMLEIYSLYSKDTSGLIILGQRVNYIVRKYIFQIN